MITGRYPWGAGFYDMSQDTNHCTDNSTALPELLKPLGYKTHALGKWDVGFMEKKCSPTERGFDTFFGYYMACEADYWYHGASGGYPPKSPNCTGPGGELPIDLSNLKGEVRKSKLVVDFERVHSEADFACKTLGENGFHTRSLGRA